MIRVAPARAVLAAVILLGLAALSQQTGSNHYEAVSAVHSEPLTVKRGGRAVALVTVDLRPGYHVNSNRPGSDLLKPTVLRLQPPPEIVVRRLQYPAAEQITPEFAPEEKLKVYSGRFSISVPFSVKAAAARGKQTIRGELSLQACNDRACFAPKTLPVSIDVTIE